MQSIFYNSPLGLLNIIASENHLLSIVFMLEDNEILKSEESSSFGLSQKYNLNICKSSAKIILRDTSLQLNEYFLGKRKTFDLPIFFKGTEFQKKVWYALLNIPYAKTCSYQEQAKFLGNEKAVRAIGSANNKNPLPIIVPCHRVISKDGKLAGYAGGLEAKKYLLNLEQNHKSI